MDKQTIRGEVRESLNDTVAPFRFTTVVIDGRIDEIHKEVASMTKVIKGDATTNTVSGTAEYLLPESSDVLEIDDATYNSGDSQRPLIPISIEELNDRDPLWRSRTGTPTRYYLIGNRIGLVPKPDAVVQLKIYYSDKAVTMTDTDSPRYPDQYHKIIIWGVVEWCLRDDRDHQEANKYEQKYGKSLAKMKAEQDARKGKVYIMKPHV